MQKFSLLLLMLFSFNASAQVLMPVDGPFCGPYPYKTREGEIKNLPILSSYGISQGYLMTEEMPRLKEFVNGWFQFFAKNGDLKIKFKTLCYGYFDDASSTGANALAYGDKAILIGTKMKRDIHTSLDTFVANQIQHYNPGSQRLLLNLNKTAAESFVIFHEMSHTLQNIHRLSFSGFTAKQKELHADCSGAFMFTMARLLSNTWKSEDMLAGMMYAYALGDTNTTDSDHHGFPDHRQNAFSVGMSSAINLKNSGYDLNKITSKEIMDVCSQSYR
jgi:hypothetical protein